MSSPSPPPAFQQLGSTDLYPSDRREECESFIVLNNLVIPDFHLLLVFSSCSQSFLSYSFSLFFFFFFVSKYGRSVFLLFLRMGPLLAHHS